LRAREARAAIHLTERGARKWIASSLRSSQRRRDCFNRHAGEGQHPRLLERANSTYGFNLLFDLILVDRHFISRTGTEYSSIHRVFL
jgi:hypothetical protein